MEKLTDEMELEGWEILSDDGFLDVHHSDHEDLGKLDFNPKGVFDTYFKYPLPDSTPIQLDHMSLDDEVVKEVIKVPILNINKELPKDSLGLGDDQAMISQQQQQQQQQVFFNKMKENQFVDIKMDSPESGTGATMGVKTSSSPIEGIAKDNSVQEKNCLVDSRIKEEIKWEAHGGGGGGLNILGWRITRIGALCSIGMAAASIFIFILGSQNRNKHQQQNQKLQFQIYTDDKRFKQVVHHATKLNQAISSVRGGPFSSAHFTYGGYYVCDSGV